MLSPARWHAQAGRVPVPFLRMEAAVELSGCHAVFGCQVAAGLSQHACDHDLSWNKSSSAAPLSHLVSEHQALGHT